MTSAPDRIAGVVLIVLIYLLFCLAIRWRHSTLRRRAAKEAGYDAGPILGDGETSVSTLVAFASQTGFAERLARQTAHALREAGVSVHVRSFRDLTLDTLRSASQALFIVSTTGEGDAPDSAAYFSDRLMAAPAAMPQLRYAILAPGDRSYRNFCGFARKLDRWLQDRLASPLFPVIEIDNEDAAALRQWQYRLGELGAATHEADWKEPHFDAWILSERRRLNPGNKDHPAFHVGLKPVNIAISWQAGDIAEIEPANDPASVVYLLREIGLNGDLYVRDSGRDLPLTEALSRRMLPHDSAGVEALRNMDPQEMLTRLPPLPVRSYSIASLSTDGQLELLVREHRRPEGIFGFGSGWLAHHAAIGGTVSLRIRENGNFRGPPDDRPIILIGNGTGLAGLRAHLKARAKAGHKRNWLLFGERSRTKDFFYREEIEEWQNSGLLERLDLAFSRDQAERIYVQHLLHNSEAMLRGWIIDGASIYVCGSMTGMASGVDTALVKVLGQDTVDTLLSSGRYRRDVY